MHIIGIETEGLGTNNQMRGVIVSGAALRHKGDKKAPVSREALLKSADGTLLHPKNFENAAAFEKAVQMSVDSYLKESTAPDFIILPFDHAHGVSENQDVDALSKAVKSAFANHGYEVKTLVLASNLYDYQNVDLIHVGKHLLKKEDEEILRISPVLKSKVVETLGVPSNINRQTIKKHIYQLLHKYENLEKDLKLRFGKIKKVLSGNLLFAKGAYIDHSRDKKNVLFSLGGITDNGAIGFDNNDIDRLMNSALRLKAKGYNVIFTNSPRTPSDVTDYLYEKCQENQMDFFNAKKIASNDEEAKNFRNYNGKYKKEFERQASSLGNIYPAILDVCDFVVNTHDSFSYTSDAAALGIPSVVYTKNFIDKSRRPDCYKLFDLCHEGGYAVSLDEAIDKIEKGEKLKTKKMDSVSTQLVKAMGYALINTHEKLKSTER